MKQSPSWKANSRSASQEILPFVVQKSPPEQVKLKFRTTVEYFGN